MNNKVRLSWVELMLKIATPVFDSLASSRLRDLMAVESLSNERRQYSHLEALGRSMAGIGPWLELKENNAEENTKKANLNRLVCASLDNATNKKSRDFLNFTNGCQPVVDSAFLAQGLLRSWNNVWLKLDQNVQKNVVDCMLMTRSIKPSFCNWLMFSAMIEAFLCKAGADWDKMRIDYAIRQHMQWYMGDGIYGDGEFFHWDYYNSYVIQPMLYDIVHSNKEISKIWEEFIDPITKRIQRYAAIQERIISPEGTFPPIGRSLAYRFGAFHVLALMALKHSLPKCIPVAGVRCAMTAVMNKMFDVDGVFDKNGWLQIGFCGHQPSIGENYISTGSLYLTLCGFLPLGLPSVDSFWTDPDANWTSKEIWSGKNAFCDYAIL